MFSQWTRNHTYCIKHGRGGRNRENQSLMLTLSVTINSIYTVKEFKKIIFIKKWKKQFSLKKLVEYIEREISKNSVLLL